jgi:hypothetical protein
MNRILRILALSLAGFAVSASAATSYSIVPGQCAGSLSDAPLACIVSLSPALPTGEYPSLNFTDWILTDGHGTVGWTATEGLSGHNLSAGAIQNNCHGFCSSPTYAQFCSNGACIDEVSELTVYFEGTYIGGGEYSGWYTAHFNYTYQTLIGGSHRWVRAVTGGGVKFTE